ncbi:PUA-like domain containing protein [Naviculisporaceae sp. PSN 640]
MSSVDPSHPVITAFMAEASKALGRPLPAPKDVFAFGGGAKNPVLSTELLHKAIRGEKKATTSWPIPSPLYWSIGDLSVILDGEGKPGAVMKTTEFRECKFRDVEKQFGLDEAEGSYDDYRRGHFWFYGLEEQREAARKMGVEEQFGEDSWVLCERFEVIYPVWTPNSEGGDSELRAMKKEKEDGEKVDV